MKKRCQRRRHFILLPRSFLLCWISLRWAENEESPWMPELPAEPGDVHQTSGGRAWSLVPCLAARSVVVLLLRTRFMAPAVTVAGGRLFFSLLYALKKLHVCTFGLLQSVMANEDSKTVEEGSGALNLMRVKSFNHIKCHSPALAAFCSLGC